MLGPLLVLSVIFFRRGLAGRSSTSPMLEVRAAVRSTSARCARPTASTSTCAEGETHAIIGPNGAGKTTFIGQLAGNLRPDCGPHRASPARTSPRLPARRARAHGPRALVPDHEHLSRIQRAAQRRARGAGARRPQLPLLASGARPKRRCSSRRARFSSEVGLGARARCAGRRTSRTASSASSRSAMALATTPAPAAARRADGRHGRRGVAAHDRAASRTLQGTHTMILVEHDMDAVFRARRPHLGAGLRPRRSRPACPRRSARIRKCARAYLGEDDA